MGVQQFTNTQKWQNIKHGDSQHPGYRTDYRILCSMY